MGSCWVLRGPNYSIPTTAWVTGIEFDLTMVDPISPVLVFAACNVFFSTGTKQGEGEQWGGVHFGLQYYPSAPGGKAVNFGGYVDALGAAGGVAYYDEGWAKLDTGPTDFTNSDVFTNFGDPRTFGYNFTPGVAVKCACYYEGYGSWGGYFNGKRLRSSWWAGTNNQATQISGINFFSEYGSMEYPCRQLFKNIVVLDNNGTRYPIGPGVEFYQSSQPWEKRNVLGKDLGYGSGFVFDIGRTPAVLGEGEIANIAATVTTPPPVVVPPPVVTPPPATPPPAQPPAAPSAQVGVAIPNTFGAGYGDCIAFPTYETFLPDQWARAMIKISSEGAAAGSTGSYTGVMVRVSPTSGSGHPNTDYNWYKFETCGSNSQVRFSTVINGTNPTNNYYNYNLVPGQTYEFYLEVRGNTLVGRINGAQIFTTTQTALSSGKPGITLYNDSSATQVSIDSFECGDFGQAGTPGTPSIPGESTPPPASLAGNTRVGISSYRPNSTLASVWLDNFRSGNFLSESPVPDPTDPGTPGTTPTTISESFGTGSTGTDAHFTMIRGTLAISGGKLRAGSTNTEIDGYHTTDLGSSNHYVEADFTIGAGTGTAPTIMTEGFDGRGQSITNGTQLNGTNSFAAINYAPPVAGFYVNDVNSYSAAPNSSVLPAFDSTQKVTGSYSGRFSLQTVGRTTKGGSYYHKYFTPTTTTLYMNFWWKFDANMGSAGGDPSLVHWRGDYSTGPQYGHLRFNSSRKLAWANASDVRSSTASTPAYSADTWYQIELTFNSTAGTNRMIVKSAAGDVLQDTSHNFASGGVIGFVEFGALQGNLEAYPNLSSFWFDEVQMSNTSIGAGAGDISGWYALNARMATTGLTYYSVETSDSKSALELFRVSNGTYTSLGTYTTGWALNSTHKVRLEANGTAIKVYTDGVQRISVADSGIASGTKVGVHCYTPNVANIQWDNLVGAALSGGGTPTPTPTPDPTPTPPPSSGATGKFYTSGRHIVDPQGYKFIPIGMNMCLTSRTNTTPGQLWNDTWQGVANGHSDEFVNTWGGNCVRLYCDIRGIARGDAGISMPDYYNGIIDVVAEYTAKGVTVLPSCWLWTTEPDRQNPTWDQVQNDSTSLGSGYTRGSLFMEWYNFCIDNFKNNTYVWLNPLNEPWDYNNLSGWSATHTAMYDYARARGWTGIFVADMPGFGQGIASVTNSTVYENWIAGKQNAVLAYHNYEIGDSSQYVATAHAKNLPIIIGESGKGTSGSYGVTSFEWCYQTAFSTGWGLVFWAGAYNKNDNLTLRNGSSIGVAGPPFYQNSLPLTDAGTKMMYLGNNKPLPQAV
jgi:hypothetical protein